MEVGTEGSHASRGGPVEEVKCRGRGQAREGAPLGMAHTPVLTTPSSHHRSQSVTKKHFRQHRGKHKRSKDFAISRASRVQAASRKAK